MSFRTLVALLALAAVSAIQGLAHHSFAAEFDEKQPFEMTGILTKVQWQNPHIWYYLDVKNADGSVTNWGFSGAAPGALMRRGVAKDALKLGSVVIVRGFKAKDGSHNAYGSRVTFEDGRNVFTSGTDAPEQSKAGKQ